MCHYVTFISYAVPQPNISLISDIHNPILSGSTPTLICIVELHPAVDVPLNVNTVWTSPSRLVRTSGISNLLMRSVTLYTSKVVLSNVGSADAGLYTCTVSIGSHIRLSAEKSIQIG